MSALSTAKALLRRAQLSRLREMAQGAPASLRDESERLCALLYEHIRALRACHVGAGKTFASLLVCAYLPLYFEVDLQPLLRRLWREKFDDDNNDDGLVQRVGVFVPVVLTPPAKQIGDTPAPVPRWLQPEETASQRFRSGILFVEVFDEEDLLNSFERRGRYQLMEPREEILQQTFFTSCDGKPCEDTVLRRGIACDDWESLFPECTKPTGLIDLSSPERDVVGSTCMLVLAPGVLFDCAGGRIGKGGGYYDRFLHYQRTRMKEGRGMLMAWGIGRETQLLSAEEGSLPVSAQDTSGGDGMQDAVMDCVVTPIGFMRCTLRGREWCGAL